MKYRIAKKIVYAAPSINCCRTAKQYFQAVAVVRRRNTRRLLKHWGRVISVPCLRFDFAPLLTIEQIAQLYGVPPRILYGFRSYSSYCEDAKVYHDSISH